MTNKKNQKFIDSQIVQLQLKIQGQEAELEIYLDASYNFVTKANICRNAITSYNSRITALESEEEYNK